MAIRQDFLDTNYGSICIPECGTIYVQSELVTCYTLGNDTATQSIDISADAGKLPYFDIANYTAITTPLTAEEMEDPTYLAAKEAFVASVGWIWGGLEEGGMFFYKDNAGIHFGVIAGFGQYVDGQHVDEYCYIGMLNTYSQTAFSLTECSQIAIFHNEVPDDKPLPDFVIMTVDDNHPMHYKTYSIWDISIPDYGWSDPVASNYINPCIDDPLYSELVGLVPIAPDKVWYDQLEQPISLSLPDDFGIIYGDWRGDANIDLEKNPGAKGGNSGPNSNPGSYPTRSDDEPFNDPNASGIDATNSGFVTLYNPTVAQVRAFNDFLFSGDITEAIATALKKLIADPIDYLVFIAMVRFVPNRTGLSDEIKFCGVGSNVAAKIVSPQFQVIEYGDLVVPQEAFSFADYGGYSKVSIRLPYCGTHELNVDEVRGSTLNLQYEIDLLTGSCVARLHVNRPPRDDIFGANADTKINGQLYEFTGNCFEMLPLNATDFRNTFSSLAQFVTGAASVVTGNAAGLGAMGSAVMSAKPSVEHSGDTSTSYGYMGIQDPYLILERPIQAEPVNFYPKMGGMANIYYKLSTIKGTGYTELEPESLDLNNIFVKDSEGNKIYPTQNELDEIRSILSGGFFV